MVLHCLKYENRKLRNVCLLIQCRAKFTCSKKCALFSYLHITYSIPNLLLSLLTMENIPFSKDELKLYIPNFSYSTRV